MRFLTFVCRPVRSPIAVIRYLTRDDEQQWQQTVSVIQENQPCFITNIVLCELVWVLRGASYMP
ncbi:MULTISPECIES: hypothetical protein [unclassified Coleofasciculus]|uniref:hypothetical protein n=1 Tax=unclassified Coleofasciculus TaxID=2692782 RepID=UPI00187EE198|nr:MULTISPECIES: hypothetical protein [unclassified Coleofasciculus]MBE9128082.1 hypothetical protein [Coleofasciculus sp. LEGE 07081]MBE9146955.1 hypothetical protein [Coleofasciculus sp. LEGE 07092]